jgi:hypothetical protein
MKTRALLTLSLVFLSTLAFAKDHSNDYQVGTFISATAVADGTITSTLHGDGTTVAGDVYSNQVGVYKIKVADGTWFVTTLTQNQDSMLRGMGMTPTHFKSEKANPLDSLKNGDRVLFRLHERHYLNGKFTLMAIPYADRPNKEVEFSTRWVPDVAAATSQKPTDNVKAMCDAHKLSSELEKQLCVESPAVAEAQRQAPQAVAQPQTGDILTNQSIVDMVKAGATDDAIVSRIKNSKTHFDVSGPATTKLMQDAPGISMEVIKAMVLSYMRL